MSGNMKSQRKDSRSPKPGTPANPFTGREASDQFEKEVRRLARELFPAAGGYAPENHLGRERDGIFDDGETIHIVEATRDRSKAKAEGDLKKSAELRKHLAQQYPDRNFKIWFVTEGDPTADQAEVANAARKQARCPVLALGIQAFGQKLVDAPAYLHCRENYLFGSIRSLDPSTPHRSVDDDQFVPLDLAELATGEVVGPEELTAQLAEAPGLYMLLGDYGAGKSMTMRHIFFGLTTAHRRGKDARFPVYLNLRDHIGQDEPSSALYDHGVRIGFGQPHHLVSAWRAGFIHLFLDGFDEVASSRFRAGARGLKDVRHRAMKLIRSFVEQHPADEAALFLSGRENYFGSPEERTAALGLKHRRVRTLSLNEFTLKQVAEYLRRLGLSGDVIPNWLPSRPLLVGYLAVRQILKDSGSELAKLSRAQGWDYLLDRIAEREAGQIADLGGDAEEVRKYIDRLATRARKTTSGRGPVPLEEMIEIFRDVMPSTPDEAAQQLLLRMAGLASASQASPVVVTSTDQEDAREFVDEDLADAARAGDVIRFVEHSYDEQLNKLFEDPDCQAQLGDLGVEVAAERLSKVPPGQLIAALEVAAERLTAPPLAFDILKILQLRGIEVPDREGAQKIVIKDGYINELEMSGTADFSRVILQECLVTDLYVDRHDGAPSGPLLRACQIERMHGVSSIDGVWPGVLDATTDVGEFLVEHETVKDLRSLPLPVGIRVLLTALRKLFVQTGKGRKENAFPRGLSDAERPYVRDILQLLAKHDFAYPHKAGGPTIWISNRSKAQEAKEILRAPEEEKHPLVKDVRSL